MPSRLKSLELQGYKTFASRALLEFPADITAVVGPNGAGKSNVADSIRWVLGEQSFSLMRGRKTEDMIFSGSELRPRAGMASVSITFDNQDGWLPIDYTEVAIARRAYRDGQNEYLLNGQKVRLKEISELLAQSGLAERTYTMIGQGLVDSALSLKPDERRRFFEEAAGIGLYRSRREESITRLDSTRRNLERIKDIISELEPRLASLEKQAKRAQEYERIKADLKLLLWDWYGYHWHRVQQDLIRGRETHKSQEARLELSRNRQKETEAKIELARNELQALRSKLNAWHSQSSTLHQQRERVSRSLAVLDERQSASKEQHQIFITDMGRLEEERQSLDQRILLLEQETGSLNQSLEEAKTQVEVAQKAFETRSKQRDLQERELREARKMLVSAETKQVQVKARLAELENRAQEKTRSLSSVETGIVKENDTLKELETKVQKAVRLKEQAEIDFQDAEEAVVNLRRKIDEVESQRRKLVEKRGQLEAGQAKIKAQLDVLDQADRANSGLNQGAKFLLQSSRQGTLHGDYRPLSGLLEVPAEYEIAIAAVLGEYIDGVLLGSSTDSENALVLLEKGEKGRAVLLPLNTVKDVDLIEVPDEPGVLGNASEIVRGSEDISVIKKSLLGQVVIVKDRATARKIQKNLPAWGRAVTLQGEVFTGMGTVLAGQDGRSSLISRPRQRKELQSTLEEFEEQQDQLVTEVEKLTKATAQLRGEEQQLNRQVQQQRQRDVDASQALQRARLDLEQCRQRLEWQKKQLIDLQTQARATDEEINKSTGRLTEIQTEITSYNQTVREKSRALAELPIDELQAQVSHWNTRVAVASQAVKEAERRIGDVRRTSEMNARNCLELKGRIEGIVASLSQIENEKEIQRNEETRINIEIEGLRIQIEPAEAELQQLESKYSSLQEDLVVAQQGVNVAERYVTQAQLDMSRQKEAMETLRRKIEDDFGLVAFEYSQQVSGQEPLPLGDMVAQLPVVQQIPDDLEENINRQRSLLRRMGAINPDALSEYQQVEERYNFLKTQIQDLNQADEDLRKVISELDDLMKREFRKTFDAVAEEFKHMFTRLFGGGTARLILTDQEDPTETGIDIEARLPGRREQGLSLLSGGERSLTAVALIFSLLKVSPTPFCVLDEVDAALDESNVGRFCDLLKELSQRTQFLVITHNRNTVQTSGVIYGVTMGRDSASQLISLKLDEISEEMVR